MDNDTTTIEDTIDRYLDAYGDPDETTRRAKIDEVFAADATLSDPPFSATGADELHGAFGAVQAQFPGHPFRRTSAVDTHNGAARYSWALVNPDGEPALAGADFVLLAPDGRLARVVGFFGDPEPLQLDA